MREFYLSIRISKKKKSLQSNDTTQQTRPILLPRYNTVKLEKFQCCSNQTRPARPSRIYRSHRNRRPATSARRKSRLTSRTSSRRTRPNPTRPSTKSGRGGCCSPRRRRSSSRDVSASRNTWAPRRGSTWPRLFGWPPPRWRSGSRTTGTRRKGRPRRRAGADVRREGSLYRCWSRTGSPASRSWWSLPRIRPRARFLCRRTCRNRIGGKMDCSSWNARITRRCLSMAGIILGRIDREEGETVEDVVQWYRFWWKEEGRC